MKNVISALSMLCALQLPLMAHAAIMAVVTSSKGTTTIQTEKEEGSLFYAPEVYYNGGSGEPFYDLLSPARIGAAKLEVKHGYCAIVGNEPNYIGSKLKVLPAGTYDLKNTYGFSNGIQALSVYWTGSNGCDPKYDVALVENSTGAKYIPVSPSLATMTYMSTNAYNRDWTEFLIDFFGPNMGDSLVSIWTNGKIYYYFNSDMGGFLPLAHTLKVPTCDEVKVNGSGISGTFAAGQYSLAPYKPQDGLRAQFVSRKTDCKKPTGVQRAAQGARIRHNGNNLCLNPEGGGTPVLDTRAVLTSNCSTTDTNNRFRVLFDGAIQHVKSGWCLHPRGGSSTPGSGTDLVFWPVCNQHSIKFEYTLQNSLRQLTSGMCLHPSGGSPTPAAGTGVVFWHGCNENRLRFTFE